MSANPLTIRPTATDLAQPLDELFDQLIDATLRQVAASSARIYGQTFKLWRGWCLVQQLDPFDLRPANVLAFLGAHSVAKSTRQRQLSALRKLAQMLYILHPTEDTRRVAEALTLIKVPAGGESGTNVPDERLRRLKPTRCCGSGTSRPIFTDATTR